MGSLPIADAGVGSATSDTSMQLGGALGVAVLGTALNIRYQNFMTPLLAHRQIPPSVHQLILGSLGGALAVAANVPGQAGEALAQAARRGFVSGMDLGLLVATVVVAVAGLVALVALPSRARPERVPVRVPEDGEPRRSGNEPSLDRSPAG
jgi:hypothetical protein